MTGPEQNFIVCSHYVLIWSLNFLLWPSDRPYSLTGATTTQVYSLFMEPIIAEEWAVSWYEFHTTWRTRARLWRSLIRGHLLLVCSGFSPGREPAWWEIRAIVFGYIAGGEGGGVEEACHWQMVEPSECKESWAVGLLRLWQTGQL